VEDEPASGHLLDCIRGKGSAQVVKCAEGARAVRQDVVYLPVEHTFL